MDAVRGDSSRFQPTLQHPSHLRDFVAIRKFNLSRSRQSEFHKTDRSFLSKLSRERALPFRCSILLIFDSIMGGGEGNSIDRIEEGRIGEGTVFEPIWDSCRLISGTR